jgi:hypothetical protein
MLNISRRFSWRLENLLLMLSMAGMATQGRHRVQRSG